MKKDLTVFNPVMVLLLVVVLLVLSTIPDSGINGQETSPFKEKAKTQQEVSPFKTKSIQLSPKEDSQTSVKGITVILDTEKNRYLVFKDNGEWVKEAVKVSLTLGSDSPAIANIVLSVGPYAVSQQDTVRWSVSRIRTVTAEDFQKILDLEVKKSLITSKLITGENPQIEVPAPTQPTQTEVPRVMSNTIERPSIEKLGLDTLKSIYSERN